METTTQIYIQKKYRDKINYYLVMNNNSLLIFHFS